MRKNKRELTNKREKKNEKRTNKKEGKRKNEWGWKGKHKGDGMKKKEQSRAEYNV